LRRPIPRCSSGPPVPKVCVVTGGTGFVGMRLVEMLVERGAQKVCLSESVRGVLCRAQVPVLLSRAGGVHAHTHMIALTSTRCASWLLRGA
jgi:nucleoside-diphosphate-sugar epimerase